MAKYASEAQYKAAARCVAVTVGDPGGHGVVQMISSGQIVPDGVPAEVLESLAERGLIKAIEAVKDVEDSESGGENPSATKPPAAPAKPLSKPTRRV